tara:strand:- start:17851 stop:19287 length:1437 start_codon:yes stop_codon:yes gene_type:complete
MISCITTTYNRPKTLERAINSVIAQTHEDWELIVVHDGPASVETRDLMAEFIIDKRIKFIETEKNHGNHTKPKNVGILASKGEYISYLDDDNEYCPTFMEVLKMELELSQVDAVYGLERIFKDENDTRGSEAISFPFNPQWLIFRSYIDTNAVLHKRDAVFQVGGWDETLPRFADWNLFVRMAKAGLKFKQVPIFLTKYYLTKGNSAEKYPVESWKDPQNGIQMFAPTFFDPAGCYIWGPWLGGEEPQPKVAIFTITYDRLEYTKKMWESMNDSTKYDFRWFVWDNSKEEDTRKWFQEDFVGKASNLEWMGTHKENKGLTYASNACIDEIKKGKYDIIGKVDNDCLFLTKGWLEAFVDMWKRNRMLYMAPYPEGLIDHPGGSWRQGYATLGGEYIEIVDHLSGLCAFIDAKAYDNFRWTDKFLHGQQDGEASQAFTNMGYMPLIMPRHRVQHMNTTEGQKKDYPEYFERRKHEKQTQV